MVHKRKPSAHQKQIRFFMFLIGTIMVVFVVGVILLLNRPAGGYHY